MFLFSIWNLNVIFIYCYVGEPIERNQRPRQIVCEKHLRNFSYKTV